MKNTLTETIVSICMISYNHERYVSQAIESVLNQKVNFKYEIVIGDDCSTDSTQSIIKEFHEKYPGLIIPILRKKNIGMNKNFADTLLRARGKYIAILEGDDYWVEPAKLQKQVEFLEANPDYVISFTDYRHIVEETGEMVDHTNLHPEDSLTIRDLIQNNYISTLTCVFRNNLFREFPKEYYKLKVGDWPLHVLNARYGKAKYHRGWVTGVYRMHNQGVWSNESKINKFLAYADVNLFFRRNLATEYEDIINKNIRYYYYAAIIVYLQEKNLAGAGRLLKEMATHTGVFNRDFLKIYLNYLLAHGNIRF